MKFTQTIIALGALIMAPAVAAVNIGDWCNHDINQEYTTCDDSRTNIIYCNAGNSQWTYAYACGGGCCYNAAPPGSGTGGSYAHCKC